MKYGPKHCRQPSKRHLEQLAFAAIAISTVNSPSLAPLAALGGGTGNSTFSPSLAPLAALGGGTGNSTFVTLLVGTGRLLASSLPERSFANVASKVLTEGTAFRTGSSSCPGMYGANLPMKALTRMSNWWTDTTGTTKGSPRCLRTANSAK